MYRKKFHGKSAIRKLSIAFLSGVMTLSLGFAAACTASDDETSEKTTSVEDTQTILNGNFEFFDDSDDNTHIIYTPNSWTSSTSGNTNYVMSGIIDTSENGWAKISADDLADRLEANYALDEDDDDYDDLYVDYNGMRARDIPYADTYNALKGSTNGYYTVFTRDDGSNYIVADSQEITVTAGSETGVYTYTDDDGNTVTIYDKLLIDNPLTHNVITEDGDNYSYTDEDGNKVTLYSDDDGNLFTDEDLTVPYESHVLMIHNYVNADYRYGTAQAYTSSTTLTLEPNTAAEISLWVKTSNLIYGRNGSAVEEELGAYIAVTQTVGGNTIDTFYITAINTSNITENNGWVQYTIFIQGCDFATSTVTMELGLGRAEDSGDYSEVLEGYAFFDDVTCTLYSSLDKSETYNEVETQYINDNTTCTLTDEGDAKIFSYDIFKDDPKFTDGYGRYFLIDLASREDRTAISLGTNVTAGLTQDDDYYVTSSSTPDGYGITIDNDEDVYLNSSLNIDTTYDVLAAFTLGSLTDQLDEASQKISGVNYYRSTIENTILANASALPGASDSTTALVILSSRGAAYTATITSGDFEVGAGSYKIVSFWVKTSDMDGFTAATINIVDTEDDEITSSISVDSSSITFDVGDEEDIYGGWVQCFFYIENTLETDKTFKLEFCFGNSTIKDTSSSAYKSGYAAVTNIEIFSVSEDVYNLASTGDYATIFSFSDTDNRENNYMDSVYSALSNNIENNISRPSSYNGVNGGSASVVYKEEIDADGYDARNSNGYAGLINQDYFENYITNAQSDSAAYDWLVKLLESNGKDLSAIDAANDAAQLWKEIFGSTTIQPLLIVNTIRTFGEASAINYGFISSSSTEVSSSTYQAITVRVYVSNGAVAYIYLTDADNRTEIADFSLPTYSFWYDSVGNVLDEEPDYDDDSYNVRDHIVYYLRTDGLYEDKDGNLFANLYNYSRTYYDESQLYYAKDATEATPFEELDNDTIYYISAEEAAKDNGIQSPHYLVAYDSSGNETRVFSYSDGEYRYIITTTDSDGNKVISYSDPVSNFVIGKDNGGVELRYDNSDNSQLLYVAIDARYDKDGNLFGGKNPEELTDEDIALLGYDANGNKVGGTWQTVTFYIHTGDEAVSYVLELWSGARETSGVDGTSVNSDGSVPGSYVIFDYSNVTVDEDTYSSLTTEYSNKIIAEYVKVFNSYGLLTEGLIKTDEENISYYEELFDKFVSEGTLNESDRPSYYNALYYTYSLYDDADYVPFNADTADDGETGYDYSADDYSETLVYLSYYNYTDNQISIFVDYSATDVTIDTSSSSSTDEEDTTTSSDTNVWLLVASIVLAVVLIFTLVSLLIRDLIKRMRRNRKHGKNVYSGKRKHYIRKLKLNENAEGVEDGAETPAGSENGSEDVQVTEENAENLSEQPAENNSENDKPDGENN